MPASSLQTKGRIGKRTLILATSAISPSACNPRLGPYGALWLPGLGGRYAAPDTPTPAPEDARWPMISGVVEAGLKCLLVDDDPFTPSFAGCWSQPLSLARSLLGFRPSMSMRTWRWRSASSRFYAGGPVTLPQSDCLESLDRILLPPLLPRSRHCLSSSRHTLHSIPFCPGSLTMAGVLGIVSRDSTPALYGRDGVVRLHQSKWAAQRDGLELAGVPSSGDDPCIVPLTVAATVPFPSSCS